MFFSTFVPGGDPDGKPIISVLAKKTYQIAPGRLTEAEEQLPFVESDTYDDPNDLIYSEPIAETDLLVYKPFTDVIVTGKACTPRGKRAFHLDCEVHVGPLSKIVRVFGNRKVEYRPLRGFAISDPEPFMEMPLGYKNAYGGIARAKDGTLMSYFPNPIGKGFAIKGGFEDVETLKVPNLEDPQSPVTSENIVLMKFEEWEHAPKPASLGWTRRNFFPRYTYAGVLPEYLEAAMKNIEEAKKKDPRLADYQVPRMDFRVYQGASDGLWGKQLTGNETVVLKYLDPDNPDLQFQLPGEIPTLSIDIGDGVKDLPPVLHTIAMDMEKKVVSMVWRGSLRYGGLEELAKVKKLEIKAE